MLRAWKGEAGELPSEYENLLLKVERPSRYLGLEPLRVLKPWDQKKLKVLLIYPDAYEVGSSHYGSRIVCDIVNSQDWAICDIAFVPLPDMEEALLRSGLEILSLGYKKPAREFDIIAFSMPVHLLITNVLTFLKLAKIPLRWRDRLNSDQIVMLGGSTSFNPAPLLEFFDVIFVGEAEANLKEVLDDIHRYLSAGTPKVKVLEELLKFENLLIPPLLSGIPHRAKRSWTYQVRHPRSADFIPLAQPIHDRLTVEIARGCERTCRFCLAGIYYRPRREESPSRIGEIIIEGLKRTGYPDFSLLSLSVGDWEGLIQVIQTLKPLLLKWGVHLSLPSLYSSKQLEKVISVWGDLRRSSLTIAPEAGTERLRKVVNKKLRDSDILNTAEVAFRNGWNSIKLYFILGLPTETEEDLKGVENLTKAVIDIGLKLKVKRLKVTASMSIFTPQPFTPFQWADAPSPEEVLKKSRYLKKLFRRDKLLRKFSEIKIDDPWMAMIESVLERGDEDISDVILRAWLQGARFDFWDEWFKFNLWKEAFNWKGLSIRWYLKGKSTDIPLPWEKYVDPGISREFLLKEWNLALREEETPETRPTRCSLCGVCSPSDLRELVRIYRLNDADNLDKMREEVNRILRGFTPSPKFRRYRLAYRKKGLSRFLSGKEVYRLLTLAIERASRLISVSLARSGMKRRLKIDTGPSVPTGYELVRGYMDIYIEEIPEERLRELIKLINDFLPKGLEVLSAESIPDETPSVSQSISSYIYQVHLPNGEILKVKSEKPRRLEKELDLQFPYLIKLEIFLNQLEASKT